MEKRENIVNFEDHKRGSSGFERVVAAPIPTHRVLTLEQATRSLPCPTCGGQPHPMKVRGGYIRRLCQCEWEAKDRRWFAYSVQDQREKAIAQATSKAGVDACYTWLGEDYSDMGWDTATFEGYHVRIIDPKTRRVRDAAGEERRAYAKDLSMEFAERPVGNLIFHGLYGLGKTHLACAILNHLRSQGKFGLFTTGANLFDALLSMGDDIAEKQKTVAKMYSTPLLVIDDPDYARATEYRLNTYKEIFNKRNNRNLPTIITTNLVFKPTDDAGRLRDVIGAAAADRLNKGLKLIGLSGESYRKYQISE